MKHLNRRKMLGVSLAGGTTTVMNHAWKAAAAAHQDPIQIAVVGVRGTGRRHLQQLQGRRDVRVAALCDVDQQVLAEAAEVVQNADVHAPDLVEDYRYLLDRKSIDTLIVATPNHWHGPLATNTCQAEKDVYVESPCR